METTMAATAFHDFQVTVTDLEKSRAFYGLWPWLQHLVCWRG
jgi:hypothetical protein